MAKKEAPFRWRTNPAIIGQYILDKDVPKGAEVTLKPNEACVVLEDGRVIGVATQAKMEVNPQVGMLKRAFGGKTPNRSFLFIFLGPHDLLLRVNGRTSDGQDVAGVIGMRVTIEREDAARLLQLPAKGESTILLGHLVSLLEPELNNIAAKDFMSRLTLAELQESPEAQAEIESSVRSVMRGTLQNAGLHYNACWASWNATEYEKVLKMQDDYENAAKRSDLVEQQEQDEMDRIYRSSTRRLELEHKLKVAQLTQQAREEITGELARIQAGSEMEGARWKTAIEEWERKQAHREQVIEAESSIQMTAQRDSIEMAKLQIEEERLRRAAEAEVTDEDEARLQKARLQDIQNERGSLATSIEKARAELQLEQERAQAELGVQRDKVELEQDIKETEFDREERQLDAEAQRVQDTFEAVQRAKRERKGMDATREDSRLDSHGQMSDKVLDVLGDIAGSGEASADVKMEALRQLSELRKADVEGSKDAYIEKEGEAEKKNE